MTKKDYELTARILKSSLEQVQRVIYTFCKEFKADEKFKEDKFLKACGLK